MERDFMEMRQDTANQNRHLLIVGRDPIISYGKIAHENILAQVPADLVQEFLSDGKRQRSLAGKRKRSQTTEHVLKNTVSMLNKAQSLVKYVERSDSDQSGGYTDAQVTTVSRNVEKLLTVSCLILSQVTDTSES